MYWSDDYSVMWNLRVRDAHRENGRGFPREYDMAITNTVTGAHVNRWIDAWNVHDAMTYAITIAVREQLS